MGEKLKQNESTIDSYETNLVLDNNLLSIRELVDMWHNGRITSFTKWFQRMEQTKKWTQKNGYAAKSYMEGVITTSGVSVQGFVLCPLEYLIKVLKIKSLQDKILKELWCEMLEWCEEQETKGVGFIILDGQNRLKFSLAQFIYGNLGVSLKSNDGRMHHDVKYRDLSPNLKQEIDQKKLLVSIIRGGDIEFIKNQLISINAGEPWSPNEMRCVEFTPVSLHLNNVATHPNVVGLFKLLKKSDIMCNGGKYELLKKGDVLFIAELLHFMRYGTIGNSANLDSMYHDSDANLKSQLKLVSEIFIWVATHLNKGMVCKKQLRQEILRDVYIFLSILVGDDGIKGSSNVNYKIKLNQIVSPETFLKELINSLESERSDLSQILPTTDENGNLNYSEKNVLPNTFMINHNNAGNKNIAFRIEYYLPIFNNLIDNFISSGVINVSGKSNRNISTVSQSQVCNKYRDDGFIDIHERFPTSNVFSMKKSAKLKTFKK